MDKLFIPCPFSKTQGIRMSLGLWFCPSKTPRATSPYFFFFDIAQNQEERGLICETLSNVILCWSHQNSSPQLYHEEFSALPWEAIFMNQVVGTVIPKHPHLTPIILCLWHCPKASALLLENQRKLVLQVAVLWPVVLMILSSCILL